MGPISSVGYSNGGADSSQQVQKLTVASTGVTPASVTGVTTTNSSQSLLSVQSSVNQLFQSIGGGLEQNEMLKALIALLILAAMLQNDNQAEQAGQQMLQELGAGKGSMGMQSQFISFYSSSTTFVMESSSSTLVSNQASSAITAGGVTSASSVSQIDVIA